MTAESVKRFKDVAAGVQSVCLSLAILVGGLWTIFTFVTLQSAKEVEAELFEQAVVEIAVEAKQLKIANSDSLLIEAVATIKNIGNRNTSLTFSDPPFRIAKIEVGRNNTIEMSERSYGSLVEGIAGMTLRRTASSQFHLLHPVTEPGYYIVEFVFPLSATEMKLHQLPGQGPVVWQGSATVVVSKP